MARQYYRNPYSTRRPPERSPAPSLAGVWLLIGIFLGVGIMGVAYIFYSPVLPQPLRLGAEQVSTGDYQNRSQETHIKTPLSNTQEGNTLKINRNPRNTANNTSKKGHEDGQRFEFYTLLPGMEVALPDQKPTAQTSKKAEQKIAVSSAVKDRETPPTSSQTRNQTPSHSGGRIPSTINPVEPRGRYQRQELDTRNQQGQQTQNQAKNQTQNPPMPKQNSINASVKYIVQAGLFQKLDDADALKARLTLQGFQPRLQKIETREGSSWFRVTLGPFPSESQAMTQKQRLETQKIHGILIMQRPNG